MPIQISASLASAPTDRLGEVVVRLEEAGADYIHFDIEDGSFVPAMSLGTKIISDLRRYTRLPFDVHLMMVNPEWILPRLTSSGADRIAVHYEACPYPLHVLRQIVSLGAQAGLAFNPATPVPNLTYMLPFLSFVVILTTEPEVPNPQFLPQMLEKIRTSREIKDLDQVEWVVDGGITPENTAEAVAAGADTIVVGRAVFAGGKIDENISALRSAA